MHLATCRSSPSMLVGPAALWYTRRQAGSMCICRDNFKITNRIYIAVVTVLKSLSYVRNKKASLSGLYLTLRTHTHRNVYIYTYHWCNEDPWIPGLAPVVPEKFRDGEFALRTSGIPWLAPNPRPHQKIDTKPKPGDFSIGLLLLSQFNFPMKIHKHSLLIFMPF